MNKAIIRSGNAYKYLLEHLYNTLDLPEGSVDHILDAKDDNI